MKKWQKLFGRPRVQMLEAIRTGQCERFGSKLLKRSSSAEGRLFELYQNLPEAQDA